MEKNNSILDVNIEHWGGSEGFSIPLPFKEGNKKNQELLFELKKTILKFLNLNK